MKVSILRAHHAAIQNAINGWLAARALEVHVRHIAYAIDGDDREALILYDETPEPTAAAEKWVGEQLA